ncbi:MAG: TonB family protein [Bryobacteraceae bacterium]
MNASLILENIGMFSLQAGILILAGLALARLLRLARPLAFLQVLLATVLLLPALQSWQRPVIVGSHVAQGRVALPVTALERVDARAPVDWAFVGLAVLGLGVAARLAWLVLGLARLRSLRKYAEFLEDGVAVSTEIAGPVTFGFRRPVILLPPAVMALPHAARTAILAHERAHVRRQDWLFALGEEFVLCVLWFHPAVWWLVARIRLAREQVVDVEACRTAGSREIYVDALLAVADARMQPYFAPAPPFLRRRQLAVRIQSLVLEVPMSRFRLLSSYTVIAVVTASLAVWVTTSFPLRGAPQLTEAAPDYVSVQGAELVFSMRPVYPMAARRANVEGPVTVEVTLAANGEVADARVIAGPPELRRAALDAVLNWQFKAGATVARVVIEFRPPAGSTGEKVAAIEIGKEVPAPLAETLRARLEPVVGQYASQEIYGIVQRVDPALTIRREVIPVGGSIEVKFFVGARLPVATVPGSIRVGGQVQAANLISTVEPVYPPLARQARIQGTVRFNVVIDRTGAVSRIQVEAGHPLLVPAATDAVRQYRYDVTKLNGQPVEVQTQVDVIFTLQSALIQ